VFDEKCLKQWLVKSKTCPICRELTRDSVEYLGKLHFQRSLDPLTSSLREKNQFLQNKLVSKEKAWRLKEKKFKQLIDAALEELNETFSAYTSESDTSEEIVPIRSTASEIANSVLCQEFTRRIYEYGDHPPRACHRK
jgi:sarcosine oxidase delta subunit